MASTSSATKTVVGVFHDFREANNALQELVNNGVNRDEISLVANEHVSDQMKEAGYDPTVNIGQGAGIGAAIGGTGGLLLSLAGLTIPGIGPILAAGPIVAALGGAGIGATVGSIIGALTNLGIPEEEAGHYAEGVRRGDVLLTVRTDDVSLERIQSILDSHGAVDIDNRVSSWRNAGYSGFNQNSQPFSADEYRRERDAFRSDYSGSAAGRGTTAGTSMSTGSMGNTTASDRTYNDRSYNDRDYADRNNDLVGGPASARSNTLDDIGDRTEDTVRNTAYNTREGARELGRDVKQGAREAGYKAEDTAHDMGRGLRDVGRDAVDAVEDAGRSVRRGASRVYHRITD